MAERAASALATRPIAKIFSSPLERAVESAKPLSDRIGVPITVDERLNEGLNTFQGTRLSVGRIFSDPSTWSSFRNPWRPSWGEPYREISERMMAMAEDAWNSVDEGEVVLVSHQVAIWTFHRTVAGIPLPHMPNQRRCALSSITSFRKISTKWREESYREPATDLLENAIDQGAV